MANISSNIKERVIEIARYKGIALEKFFPMFGMTYGNFKGKSKKTPLNSTAIADISTLFPEINISWLITGNGEMILQPISEMLPANRDTGIPLIPVDAMAGYFNGEIQFSPDDINYFHLPNFRGAEFLIRIKGDSMTPKYQAGDLAVCKMLPLSSIFFQWGKPYILDTDQGAIVKRVNKGSSENRLLLVSENDAYAPFEIPTEGIYNVAQIMGIIREE